MVNLDDTLDEAWLEQSVHYIDQSTIKRPQFYYRSGDPDRPCILVSNTREQTLWCPGCSASGVGNMLTRVMFSPAVFSVWHKDDGPNIATGRLIGDRRQLRSAFRDGEDRQEEVTGYRPNYVESSPAEMLANSASDDGLQSQHDRAVSEGRKESRGRFVL